MNPRKAPPVTSRKRLRIALLVAAVALGLGALYFGRSPAIVSRVAAVLPARPALDGRPPILGERLAEAERKTKTAASALEGVAELGRLYHANGCNREAEACWRFLRQEQPADARWSYYLADLLRAHGDQDGMTGLLQETLARAPDYTPARLLLANLQLKSGELAEAERNYRLRLEAIPADPYARLGLVRVALQGRRTEEAKALLARLVEETPHFSTGHNLYAELLAAAGDADGARRHRWLGRETLRYREPEDPWLEQLQTWCYDYDRLCVLASVEFQTEQHDRALAGFERAIQLDAGRPEAYELLAAVYLKRGDAARARDRLTDALPRLRDPKAAAGLFLSLSEAYRGLQQPAEAVRVARAGLAQVGEQPELLDALGLALADAGEHGEAVDVWQAALAKSPGDAAINHHLARSFLALRRLDEALAALDRSLTLQPSYWPTLLLRGEIELLAGHLDLAEKYLRPAFESHPEVSQARWLLAEWHLQKAAAAESGRDPATAERHYREGLMAEAKHPELLVRLGLFHLIHGRPKEAIAPLASYHRLQPENAPGCLFLGQAYAATHQREKAREILTQGAQLAERAGNAEIATQCRQLLEQL